MSLNDLLTPATKQAHRAQWSVYTGDRDAQGLPERIRWSSKMRGAWPGFDVACSCGTWESRTGGATRGSVEEELFDHRFGAQTDAEVLATTCRRCQAKPGDPCTGFSGLMHPERYQEGE